jgi:hypothetical protein
LELFIASILTIITIIVAIILFVRGEKNADFRAEPYRFRLLSSVLKPEDRIIIIADNDKSNKN